MDSKCRDINGFRLRLAFLVILAINTTRVTTSNFGLFNKIAGYWNFNDFQFSLGK